MAMKRQMKAKPDVTVTDGAELCLSPESSHTTVPCRAHPLPSRGSEDRAASLLHHNIFIFLVMTGYTSTDVRAIFNNGCTLLRPAEVQYISVKMSFLYLVCVGN